MSKSEKIQADFGALRTEILAEVATHFDLTLGERIVQKILDRASERASNIQKAEAAAVAGRDEAQKQAALYEDRRVRLVQEIKELATERSDLQTAVDGLRSEYDGLLPKVQELRAEHQSYVARVQKIAG